MNGTAAASGTEPRKRWNAKPSRRTIQHLVLWVIALAAGKLEIEWPEGGEVFLTGPAERIAEGKFYFSG